jgi:LmbE family N-acetylglucosaminyl deacetylase
MRERIGDKFYIVPSWGAAVLRPYTEVLKMARFTVRVWGAAVAIVCVGLFGAGRASAQEATSGTTNAKAPAAVELREPDARYKADILLVVAHPDDEGAATAYLARAIDEGKRVAVVYGTRGGNGGNEVGTEQASGLAAIREIEARRANATLGITNVWFLDGKDTAGQDVLVSLANWQHGAALEQLVRLMRLTRPEVVLTFLPGTFIGEDHGDHQAAGVVATEAFDLAGDPTAFPSQVAEPSKRLEAYLEGLRPWQPKKIFYFPDAEREDIFKGKGPSYSVKEISKSSKKPYWRASLDAFRLHQTQAKSFADRLDKMDDAAIEKMMQADGWADEQRFVLGKSLVGGSVTAPIFENVTSDPIPFHREAFTAGASGGAELSVELAGPWNFYAKFREAHGLTHLPHPEPPEIALQAGTSLVIPLWIRNATSEKKEFTLTADLPAGWKAAGGTGKFIVGAKQTAGTRVEIDLPAIADEKKTREDAKEITVRAEADGKAIGAVKMKVELRKKALPE